MNPLILQVLKDVADTNPRIDNTNGADHCYYCFAEYSRYNCSHNASCSWSLANKLVQELEELERAADNGS